MMVPNLVLVRICAVRSTLFLHCPLELAIPFLLIVVLSTSAGWAVFGPQLPSESPVNFHSYLAAVDILVATGVLTTAET